jgi:hypothetical protein
VPTDELGWERLELVLEKQLGNLGIGQDMFEPRSICLGWKTTLRKAEVGDRWLPVSRQEYVSWLPVQLGQATRALGDVWVVVSQGGAEDVPCQPVQRLRLRGVPQFAVQLRQVVQADSIQEVLLSEVLPHQIRNLPGRFQRWFGSPLGVAFFDLLDKFDQLLLQGWR